MNFKKLFFGIFLLFMISGLVPRAFGYKLMGGSWPNATTTMYSTGGNSTSTFDSAFVEAMKNWNGLSKFVYTSATGYADPCADPNNYGPPYTSGYSFAFSLCGDAFGDGTLAVNVSWTSVTTILQAGTVFNTAYTWDVHNGSSGLNIDFRRVATHELGHALGLDHDNTYSALMNTTYSDTIETPQTDDINGLVAIYGGGGGTTTSKPSAPALTVSISGLTVSLSWSTVTGATGYTLYYAPYPAGTPIGSAGMGTKTSFSATLPAGAAYYVAIKAYNSSGSSGYSNIEHFTLSTPTKPNLTPYQPSGWSDKIVASTTTGANTDSGSFTTSDTIYIDWAVINGGTADINTTFYTELYVDGDYEAGWYNNSLPKNKYTEYNDYSLGTLSAGSHIIKIVTDVTSAVAESNESDNEYSKTINVSNSTTTDTTAPENTTGSSFINRGTSTGTSSTSVTLSISATDAVGVTGYYASETSTAPTASASGWTSITSTTSYSSSVPFTLSSKNGTKTVYVWFKDAAGNVSSSVRDTITLSTTGTTVTDVEGNVYNTVKIGAQTWMKENLKVTKYRDGTAIGTTTADISTATSPKYQWAYNGNESNAATYGRLYTWYAVTDSRGVCPSGWHLPTDAEWTTLTTYLGGVSVAGGKMKETGTSHWNSPNTSADNSSGFTALPGGYRYDYGAFYAVGYYGFWWSATEGGTYNAWSRGIGYYYGNAERGSGYKLDGFSVRCVGD